MDAESYYDKHGNTDKESGCIKFFRALMIGINVLLTAAAISGLAVGLLDRDKMKVMLRDLCPSYLFAFDVYMSLFGTMLVFSFLGFLALYTRNVFLRIFYFLYLLVVFLVAMGTSIACVLLTTDLFSLQGGWEKLVASDKFDLSKFETYFNCSGWDKRHDVPRDYDGFSRMPYVPPSFSNKMRDTQSSPDDTGVCPIGPVCEKSNERRTIGFTQTCKDVVVPFVRKHMMKVLPIAFSITVLAFIAMIVTCMLHNKRKRDLRYGGLYYRT